MIDPVEFGKAIGAMVKAAVADLAKSLGGRIEALENRPEPDLKALIAEAMPAPIPGKDAEPVNPEVIRGMVAEAVSALPRPQDGKSVTAEEVMPTLLESLQKAIEALPVPKDGQSVTLADVQPLIEQGMAKWALDFERRAQDTLQRAIDRMPRPADGKDGRDAFALEDFDLSLGEDGRTVTMSFSRGETVQSKSVKLPALLYRGVFREGEGYEPGDTVTWGGSLWHCNEATTDKPELTKAWTLAAKRGRDGKDGKAGEQGPRGDKGEKGADLIRPRKDWE